MDNERKIKELKSRYSQLEDIRNRFIDRWTDAQQYVAPNVYSWANVDSIPEVPVRFSSKPCDYLDILVSGLTGYSISPNIIWFKLGLENQNLLNRYGVKDWLEEVENIMNAEFRRSNLYMAASKFIQDTCVIGHGVMLCDEDMKNNRLRFTTIRSNEAYLDCNEYGEIDTVFRRFTITLRNAVDFFGIENLSEQLQEDYKEVSKWNNKIEILYCVQPREKFDPQKQDAKNKPYEAIYLDLTNNKIILESGYDENPYAVFEWDQMSGLPYSTSPAMNAMPDIKYLNIAAKTSMRIAQTSAEPPMKASRSLKNINLVPKGFTYVDTNEEVLEPIRTGENYPITLEVLKQIEDSVKAWFNVDFFLMLQQKQGQMTATEVMELQGEKSAVLSKLIVNLNNALQKIISRSFNLLMKEQKLPPVPETIQDEATSMKVEFIGPLAQAQRKYHTMGGIQQALSFIAPIMNLYPNAGDYINPDELMKRAMEGQGMPQAVIREEDEVQKIREQRAIAQQQAQLAQQQAQSQELVMNNLDKLGQLEQNNPTAMNVLNEQRNGSLVNG